MSSRTILLVEDDDIDCSLIERAFRSLPFEYMLNTAKNGEEALEKLEQHILDSDIPDLVLLDLHMPKMNGFELLKKIRLNAKLQTMRIVVLTGSDSDEALLQSYDAGATSYTVKPHNRLEFRRFVAEIAEWWVTEAA